MLEDFAFGRPYNFNLPEALDKGSAQFSGAQRDHAPCLYGRLGVVFELIDFGFIA